MKNFYLRLFAAASLLCCFGASAQTVYTLDWGSSFGTWTDGQTSGTASNIASSGVNCTVTMTKTGGIFSQTAGTGFQTPTVTNAGFTIPGSAAGMRINMDFTANTQYTDVVYDFGSAVTGIKLNIVDIDKSSATSTTYFDRIEVSGSNGISTYYPVLSKYVVSSNVLGFVAGNAATANTTSGQGGNSASTAADQTGTVMVDFGTAVLKKITIRYLNGSGADADPANQAIAIGNLSFLRVNVPPVSNNFTHVRMLQGQAATAIPGLVANDADGSIASYTITSLPAAAAGVLYLGGIAVTVNQVLTPAQASTLQFDPAFNYTGTASFNFTATDNLGSVSNTATYRLPVLAQPPVANNIMENSMVNSAAATSIQPLSASDVDGSISSYTILSIPTGAQSILYCCSGTAITANQVLTPAQIATLQFDPAPGYTGNASFTYNAVDNSGNTSNTANYTIPVTAAATNARPPLSNNITAQTLNSSLSSTAVPSLQAADLDGIVVSYKILTIPNSGTQGTLYCCGGSAVSVNQVLTPAQAATLQFDPLQTFTGTASFTYTATDNSSLTSNTATYNIPVVNRTPVSTNLSVAVPFNAAATAISPLSGFDADGSIASYTITTVPTGAQGVLYCCGGSAVTVNQVLTPAQAATLQFTPTTGFTGTANFTYTSTDDNSNVSAAAIYNLVIEAQPPVSIDVTNATIANTAAATAISGLSATDPDGSIASYTILTLPATTQGVLYCCSGTVLTAGQVITAAQAATLQFDPAAGYTGMASFAYSAIDNAGFSSNVSAYNIPVSGTGNIPPVAKNVTTTAIANTAAATSVAALVGTDADGTIASYTITSIPAAAQGILYCCGGTAITAGQVITAAQATTLQFDPVTGYTGTVNFSYTATDNSGGVSYSANYSIPVTGVPPVAKSVTAAVMSQTASATAIPSLSATDADGTVSTYYITSLPATSQGVLSIPCPVTLTGATCTGGYQDLTAAVLANYPAGLPLTASQAGGMRFDPAGSYTGNVVFNYYVDDNSGMTSNLASYTLPVSGLNPLSYDVVNSKLSNANAATAINALNGADGDGTISSYVITSLPPASQGVLSMPCPATPTGATCTSGYANLTASVLSANAGGIVLTPTQAAALKFDPAAGFIGNATFNYSAYDNNNNLSNIAAYAIPVGSTVTLPLSLLNFDAERRGADIVVNWKTTNENGLDRYEIEWSADALNFTAGGSVAAKNTASGTYSFTLYNYTAPVYYLRLKTVETAGKNTYSNVVAIRLDGALVNGLSTHPNPVVDKMNVKLTSAVSGTSTVRILNMVGATVYQQKQTLVKGENLFELSDLKIPSGSYLLQVNASGIALSQKFVVQK